MMLQFEMSGFQELEGELRRLSVRAEALDGTHAVRLDELLSPAFLQQWTDFPSFDEMVQASGFAVESQEDFEAIPDAEWDRFVGERTRFASWSELLEKATEEWATQQLGM